MKLTLKIDVPEWAQNAQIQKLMSTLGGGEKYPQSMFVGGCVRNTLLKEPVADIDIATQLLPDQVIKLLEKKHIKVVPTGINHGTVSAIMDGVAYEITTLRRDDETDGRHAKVSFTQDWAEDAKRRDFTMNALFMDMAGNIFDPTGQGVDHLKQRRFVFVGEAQERVKEDYLRILRFFRFYAQYSHGEPDQTALQACHDFADKIETLSRERITSEFLKTLNTDKAPSVVQLMREQGVLSDIISDKFLPTIFEKLIVVQNTHQLPHVMSRLFIVAGCKARIYEEYLRLSHAQQNFLVKLEMVAQKLFFQNDKNMKKAIYHHGKELIVQGYFLCIAKGEMEERSAMMDVLLNWIPPECPITGETLIAEGYKTGPELGQELTRRQEEWLDDHIL